MGTPLCEAVINGKYEAVECLLINGADVDRSNRYRMTALHIACMNNDLDIASLLLSYGADMHKQDSNNSVPISRASSYEMIDLLVCNGFDFNDLNGCDGVILHMYNVLSKRCSKEQLYIAYNMVAAKGMLAAIRYLYTIC